MKIQVLIENTKQDGCCLTAEHGLSLYITYREKNYLLDAGATSVFLENADQMEIAPEHVEFCMLSHGHYDHSGGFTALFRRSPQLKLYASEHVREDYYSNSGKPMYAIGLQEDLMAVLDEHLVPITETCEIAEGIWGVPHNTPGLEKIGAAKKLYHKVNGEYLPDDFQHEVSYVFDTEKGLVICNSCSHGGILTILREVTAALPGKPVYAFIGGLHMKGMNMEQEISTFSKEEIHEICEELKLTGIRHIYTGHCTGSVALGMLQEELGDQILPLHTGMEFEV